MARFDHGRATAHGRVARHAARLFDMHMHMRMHIETYVHIKAHVRDKLLLDTRAKWCKALRLYLRFANTHIQRYGGAAILQRVASLRHRLKLKVEHVRVRALRN